MTTLRPQDTPAVADHVADHVARRHAGWDAGWDALAADGSIVKIRPVRPDDDTELADLHARVSDRSIYLRFFSLNRRAAGEFAHYLSTSTGPDGNLALVAESGGRIVGVGNLEPLEPGEAEVAFLVDDAFHGRGLGTLLLEQLVAVAREHGIRRLRADTLAENSGMLRVFTDSGFEQTRTVESGVVELTLSTAYTEQTLEAIADRERAAEVRSLTRLLSPHSVAVVGAGRRPGGIGHEVLRNLLGGGFTGNLYAVNPNATQIAGVPAYASIADIPATVDLAVIAVPPDEVLGVIDECGRAGAGGAVILTSGFGEAGGDGSAAQHDLVQRARRHGMRLIGPNCLGIVNTDADVRLDATFASVRALPGSLALASQSGAVGIAVLDHASRLGLGVSEFVSLGNKADVSGNDLLLHWWSDPRTDVIGLYLESLGNPRKFGRLARMAGRTKPVLVVKAGRSAGGRRAGASHTAAAATPDTAVDALFAQTGVLRMDTIEELIDTARVLAGQPLPGGRRIGIVGNAGGAGVLAADTAASVGLDVPQLSETTRLAIQQSTGAVAADNPIDLGAAARPETLSQAIRTLIASGEVDAVLAVFAATRAGNLDAVYAAIADSAAEHAAAPGDAEGVPGRTVGTEIPVVVNCLGAPDAAPQVLLPGGRRLPVFPFPEAAIRAIGHAVRYAEWRGRPQGAVPHLDRIDTERARELVRRYLDAHPDGGWLEPDIIAQLLAYFGVTLQPTTVATDLRAATEAAHQFGYPVALKSAAAGIVHKTDVGGVRLNLADRHHLQAAYDEMVTATGSKRVVVQPMAPRGVELVIGMVREAVFGPVLMAGSGGVLTDVLADRRWRALPLTDLDAQEMVRSLRSAPLLAGYRGSAPADVPAVLDILHRIAHLAETIPELAELDINPLIATPTGAYPVDARLRLLPATAEPNPYTRHLR